MHIIATEEENPSSGGKRRRAKMGIRQIAPSNEREEEEDGRRGRWFFPSPFFVRSVFPLTDPLSPPPPLSFPNTERSFVLSVRGGRKGVYTHTKKTPKEQRMKKQESRRAEGGGWQNGTFALHGRGREEGRRSGFSIFQPSSPPPYLTGETASLAPPSLPSSERRRRLFQFLLEAPLLLLFPPPCHAIDGFCSQRPRSGKFVVLSLLPPSF